VWINSQAFACCMKVSTDVDGSNSWKLCFKVDGVHLPTEYLLWSISSYWRSIRQVNSCTSALMSILYCAHCCNWWTPSCRKKFTAAENLPKKVWLATIRPYKKNSIAAGFLSGSWNWHCKIRYKSTCVQLQFETRRSQATRNGIGIRPEPVNGNRSYVLKMPL